eukprot:gene12194-25617_t
MPYCKQVYVMGVMGVLLCCLPHLNQLLPTEINYDKRDSPIYDSMKSPEFIYVLLLSIGACVPMLFEYIIDFISIGFKKDTHIGYLSRLLLLISLLFPDMLALLYLIPYEKQEWWGAVTSIRTMLCICVAFAQISRNGINCRRQVIICIAGLVLRSFVSMVPSTSLDIAQIALSFVGVVSIFILNLNWFRNLKGIESESWTPAQMSCSVYMASLMLISSSLLIGRMVFGPMNSHSSISNLIAYKITQAFFETQEACEIAVEILNDLLAYEKLEAGIMTLEKKHIHIWPFIRETLRPFSIQAVHSGVLLQCIHEEDTLRALRSYVLHADRSKLSQVLRNLMSNAIKFTPSGGTVTVSLTLIDLPTNNSVLICSNGGSRGSIIGGGRGSIIGGGRGSIIGGGSKSSYVGIDQRRLRIDTNLINVYSASLTVSKSLMTLHEGTISAVSEGTGQGCTFSIELPVYPCSDDIDLDTPLVSDQSVRTERLWSMGMSPDAVRIYTEEKQQSALPTLLMVDDSDTSKKMTRRLVSD